MGFLGFKTKKEREAEQQAQANPHLYELTLEKGRYIFSRLQPIAEKKDLKIEMKEPTDFSDTTDYAVYSMSFEEKTGGAHDEFSVYVKLDLSAKNEEIFYSFGRMRDGKYKEDRVSITQIDAVCQMLKTAIEQF